MTDEAIIKKALQRYDEICEEISFTHGDFEIWLLPGLTAKGIVHNGQVEYVVVPNGTLGCNRKIQVRRPTLQKAV